MADPNGLAFGAPGMEPRWSSSAKCGVGTALESSSRVWFTLSHGIFNEIYYPRVDEACTRDLGFIVTDGGAFFSEERRDTESVVSYLAEGVPAYALANTCRRKRYRIEKSILSDPLRSSVLQQTRFVAVDGSLERYRLYALLAPHIDNRGYGNTAWIGEYKGTPMLFARRAGTTLALAADAPLPKRSVGYVGASDGWQDLSRHGRMQWEFTRAEEGNTALTAEIDLPACDGRFLLVVAFGRGTAEAGLNALASLQQGFEAARSEYIRGWQGWKRGIRPLPVEGAGAGPAPGVDLYEVSLAVLRCHEAKDVRGGIIASLSIPWGASKGDDDLGGYHLVWPRDLAEVAGALLAAGAGEEALRVIEYLRATQEADGHWAQNMWIDGSMYWRGVQMDETAFPILLVDLARREELLTGAALERYWQMVRRAALYLLNHGPVSQEDRWEEDPGYSPFTLAVEIAAMVTAAELAERFGDPGAAAYLRETADIWNASVERWTYAGGTPLAERLGVDGYYVRIAPPESSEASSPSGGFVTIKNRPPGQSSEPATQIISPDALALVRFGLRSPQDPRIVNTVRVIDALLRVDTPLGAIWHRYNDDGYGEHEDGAPFDGTGVGRAWPLLTGERAHYELAAGHREEALKLMKALEAFANEGGLIPEQIWDSADIPGRELFFGRPSGSAMPLAWAHAEYVKLRRSLHDGSVYDTPAQTRERYTRGNPDPRKVIWRFNQKCRSIPAGTGLRLELPAAALVRWSADGWSSSSDARTRDTGLGPQVLDMDTTALPSGSQVSFTFLWDRPQQWEGSNFTVTISSEPVGPATAQGGSWGREPRAARR